MAIILFMIFLFIVFVPNRPFRPRPISAHCDTALAVRQENTPIGAPVSEPARIEKLHAGQRLLKNRIRVGMRPS